MYFKNLNRKYETVYKNTVNMLITQNSVNCVIWEKLINKMSFDVNNKIREDFYEDTVQALKFIFKQIFKQIFKSFSKPFPKLFEARFWTIRDVKNINQYIIFEILNNK